MATSKISWLNGGAVWNCVVGCTPVDYRCQNCYARELHNKRHKAWRDGWKSAPAQYRVPFSTLQLLPERLTDPLHWKKGRRVFVDSVSDLHHKDVPFDFIRKVHGIIALCQQHQFIVLTKRPDLAAAFYDSHRDDDAFPNLILGYSASDQATYDAGKAHLLACPAAYRAFSLEPLIGPIRMGPLDGISLCIVGGESGPRARPCNVEWIRSIVEQCKSSNVCCYVKQFGSNPVTEMLATGKSCRGKVAVEDYPPVKLKDRAGADMSEWPEDLRVRQWPKMGGAK